MPNSGKIVEKLNRSYIVGENVKWCSNSEIDWLFLIKQNIHLPYDPTIAHLNIYIREMKTCVHTKT